MFPFCRGDSASVLLNMVPGSESRPSSHFLFSLTSHVPHDGRPDNARGYQTLRMDSLTRVELGMIFFYF